MLQKGKKSNSRIQFCVSAHRKKQTVGHNYETNTRLKFHKNHCNHCDDNRPYCLAFVSGISSGMDSEAVKKYSSVKEKAAELFPDDIDGYIEYKSSCIEELYKKCGLG